MKIISFEKFGGFIILYIIWFIVGGFLAVSIGFGASEGMGIESISGLLGGTLFAFPIIVHSLCIQYFGGNWFSWLVGLVLPALIILISIFFIWRLEGEIRIKLLWRLFLYAFIAINLNNDIIFIFIVICFEISRRVIIRRFQQKKDESA